MIGIILDQLSEKFNFETKKIIALKKLNIFIGPNDSGKSYFLRELMSSLVKVITVDECVDFIEDFFNSLTKHTDFDINILKGENFNNLDEYKKIINEYQGYKKNEYEYLLVFRNIVNKENSPNIENFKKMELKKESLPKEIEKLIKELFITVYKDNNVFEQITKNADSKEDCFDIALLHYIKNHVKNTLIEEVKSENYSNLDSIVVKYGLKRFFETDIDQTEKRLDKGYMDKRIYIPLLRTIRHPLKTPANKEFNYDEMNKDIFTKRIQEEYMLNDKIIEVVSGLKLFYQFKSKNNGTKSERANIEEFINILSKYFFDSKKIEITPFERTSELNISIDNGDDFALHNVGDGISQLIIMLFTMIVSDQKLIFIEEPETGLHPGFQKLLSNLMSDGNLFKDKVVFVTSHSNHIIDRSLGVCNNRKIFKIQKTKDITFNLSEISYKDASILEDLGVSPSSVFLANKAILVEGKYDALYIRHLLEKGSKTNNLEGLDYIFIPYGGASRVLFEHNPGKLEIDELTKSILNINNLTNDYLFVMDDDGLNEKGKSAKDLFYQNLKEKLDDKLYKLSCYEIENIVSKKTLVEYISKKTKANHVLKNKIEEYINNYEENNLVVEKLTIFFSKIKIALNLEFNDNNIDKELMYELFLKEENTTNSGEELINKIISFLK